MSKCLCGCLKDVAVNDTGRPGKFYGGTCRVRYHRQQKNVTKLYKKDVTKLLWPDILFYNGLNETSWNHHVMETGTHVCIAPVTISTEKNKVTGEKYKVLRNTHLYVDPSRVKHILLDSGAFSDGIELDKDGQVVKSNRLTFDKALQRQLQHAYKYHYVDQVEAIVSYDLLIDETWLDGERSKFRWSVESAEYAVQETVAAAQYMATQRKRIDAFFGHHVNLVLSAQGVEASQYVRCAEEIVKVMKTGDIFGLGGWCITGLMRHVMLPAAAAILPGVFEVLGKAGVKRVHVFGVTIPKLLGFLLHLCDRYGIQLSTDSSGPCTEPAKNGNWGYGSWTDPAYQIAPILESCKVQVDGKKAPTCTPDTRCRGQERNRHVALTRDYLANFRDREPDLVTMLPVPLPTVITSNDTHLTSIDARIKSRLCDKALVKLIKLEYARDYRVHGDGQEQEED